MDRGIAVQCNAGRVKTKRQGNFGSLKVWAMKEGIANVLSLGEIVKKYRVTYDSMDGYFVVHTPKGEVRFVLDEHGMPVEVDEEGNPIVNERATWDASNPRRSRSSFVGRLLKVGRYHYRGADVPPRRF